VVALGLLISGASMVTLGHGSIALVGWTVVVGAGSVLVLTTVWLDLRHRRARRSQSGRWPRRKPFLAFRQGASDRTPRPREELSEAEFRRLEDEQEAMYQHGNKMDNGPIGPYGSL
jgi:hypothetical protein